MGHGGGPTTKSIMEGVPLSYGFFCSMEGVPLTYGSSEEGRKIFLASEASEKFLGGLLCEIQFSFKKNYYILFFLKTFFF